MNDDKAPFCPVSYDQDAENPRGTSTLRGTAPIRLPSIPLATDLPSLLRSVNIMRDILRTLTTSLTVNNFYGGQNKPARQYGKKDYNMSDYFSEWYQTKIEPKDGIIYNKSGGAVNRKMKAYISRIDSVHFRNNARDNDQRLIWRYVKNPDGEVTGDPVFEEDYFERVINVYWAPSGPSGPTAPSGPSGPPPAGDIPVTISWGGRGGPSLACAFFGYSKEQAFAEADGWLAAHPEGAIYKGGNNTTYHATVGAGYVIDNWSTSYTPWDPPIPHFTWHVMYAYPYVVGQARPDLDVGLSIGPGG